MHADVRRLLPLLAIVLAAVGLFVVAGCGDDDDPLAAKSTGTCIGCHGDAGALQATALPDPPPPAEDPGEG